MALSLLEYSCAVWHQSEDGADVESLMLLLHAVLLGSLVELLRGLVQHVHAVSGVPIVVCAGYSSTFESVLELQQRLRLVLAVVHLGHLVVVVPRVDGIVICGV